MKKILAYSRPRRRARGLKRRLATFTIDVNGQSTTCDLGQNCALDGVSAYADANPRSFDSSFSVQAGADRLEGSILVTLPLTVTKYGSEIVANDLFSNFVEGSSQSGSFTVDGANVFSFTIDGEGGRASIPWIQFGPYQFGGSANIFGSGDPITLAYRMDFDLAPFAIARQSTLIDPGSTPEASTWTMLSRSSPASRLRRMN
jgi:hypothetical protein